MEVEVVNRGGGRLNRARLVRIAKAVMEAEGCGADTELSVAIGDDAWIKELNLEYKGKKTATDVLAFAQEEPEGMSAREVGGGRLLGDVAISAETAARQGQEMGHGAAYELAVLLAHGILHLTGWRDGTAAERRRMLARGEQVLESAGVRRRS
jgi:probable rRNA maturation factor